MRHVSTIIGLIMFAAICPARADSTRIAQNELYRDAMQSLSEGREQDASDALTRMIEQEPQHAGAWLDLAIIQCELGRAAEAERLFAIIEERFSPPPGIREVIASQRAHGCKGRQRRNQFAFTLGRGDDSNVNQGASNPNFSIGSGTSRVDLQLLPEYLPQRDSYTMASAEYAGELNQLGTTGIAQLRARHNDRLRQYDTNSLVVGIEQPWRLGNWGVRGTATLGLLTLGNRLYQRQAQMQARLFPPMPVPLPDNLQFSVAAGYGHVEYSTLTNFDSNTGELSGQLTWKLPKVYLQASAGRLLDRAEAARLGGKRSGWFAGFQGNFEMVDKLRGEAGWSKQHWRGESVYSPGLIDEIRQQDTALLRAALIMPIDARNSVNVEWRRVKNDENISVFQYNSCLIQVSWRWQMY